MQRDQYGVVFFTEDEVVKILYQNPDQDLSKLRVNHDVAETYNLSTAALQLDMPKMLSRFNFFTLADNVEMFDKMNQSQWHMPSTYSEFHIATWVLGQSNSPEETTRLEEELEEFDRRKLYPLLQYLKYLVDTMRENNVVWGVGRGSSVSSFVLYKIGIHKINSLKYELDWREFLR